MDSILLVGQTPPPYHGQSIATKQLFDHEWSGLNIYKLRMAYSNSEDQVGRLRAGKFLHLISLICKSWWILIRRRPCYLYYPPASPNLVPVLRDIIFLSAVRPLAKGTIFHYHAGGLPEYVESLIMPLRVLARMAFRNAVLSVEIAETQAGSGALFLARHRRRITNGIDVPDASSAIAVSEGNKKRFFYMAGLRESKGVMDIIRTAEKLRERGANFIFDVAGVWQEERTKRRFEKAVSELDLDELIVLHGRVTGEEKWNLYRKASVFFFPSYYESENFPLVLIEAMAFGLPVVATNWRGIPELVVDGKTGTLCAVKSCQQFANALQAITKNHEKYLEMSCAARNRYLNNYTQDAFLSAMMEAFESVITNNGIER